jgi:hypothetical protein
MREAAMDETKRFNAWYWVAAMAQQTAPIPHSQSQELLRGGKAAVIGISDPFARGAPNPAPPAGRKQRGVFQEGVVGIPAWSGAGGRSHAR